MAGEFANSEPELTGFEIWSMDHKEISRGTAVLYQNTKVIMETITIGPAKRGRPRIARGTDAIASHKAMVTIH